MKVLDSYKLHWTLVSVCVLLFGISTFAQDRFLPIEQKLKELSETTTPGLKEKVDISVSGVSLQEFIRALAKSNSLNINVDASLTGNVINNFNNETVSNILLFLARQYDLDFQFIGSIISITKYVPPSAPPVAPPVKSIEVNYEQQKDLLSLNLRNDTLGAVAKKITQLSGKNIVIAPGMSNTMVSGYIQGLPFDNALEKLAFANNLKVTKTEDNVYLVENNTESATTTGTKSKKQKGGKTTADDNDNITLSVETDTAGQKVVSVEGTNVPIVDIIKAASRELGISYFLFADPQGNTSIKVSKLTYEGLLTYLLKGTNFTFKKEENIYLVGERNQEALRLTKTIQLQYRSADIIVDVIPAELKKGVDIKKFPELNSIILSGSTPAINEIETFVRHLDQVVPVVLIEVIIVEVKKSITNEAGARGILSKTTLENSGIVYPGVKDYTVNSGTINNLISALSGNGIVNLGKVSKDFYLSLSFLETNSILKVRSTPRLATLNGHTASMSIGQTSYYIDETSNIIGSVTTAQQTTRQYRPVQADLAIDISPVVSGDEQVTLDIQVKRSDFTNKIAPTAPPGTTNETFKSLIRVKNEEMIILGGLEQQSVNDSGDGVPILSRIPIIKWLFSYRVKERKKHRLNVFIRPTVIY